MLRSQPHRNISGRPGLSSITMASTLLGMPCSGQTNSRAVAAQKMTKAAVSITRALRQRLPRREGSPTSAARRVIRAFPPLAWPARLLKVSVTRRTG